MPTPVKCLKGKRFGRLVVQALTTERRGKAIVWECLCDCGKIAHVPSTALKRGASKSCGCLRREVMSKRQWKHGHDNTPEYKAWIAMKRRCLKPEDPHYHHYGGRGISIHPEWINSFESFLAHIGPKPKKNLSLDRIDNNKGYVPGNVRWATWYQQLNNRRNVRYITIDGVSRTPSEWSRYLNIPRTVVGRRLKDGMSLEDAFGDYKPRREKK